MTNLLAALSGFKIAWPRCRPCVCPARHVVIGKYFYRVYIAS